MLESHEQYPLYQGLYVKLEPDDDSMTIFWNEGGSEMGTIDELTIYKDDKSKKIDLTAFSWHSSLIAWHKFFQDNIRDGYKNINKIGWLKLGGLCSSVEKEYLIPLRKSFKKLYEVK